MSTIESLEEYGRVFKRYIKGPRSEAPPRPGNYGLNDALQVEMARRMREHVCKLVVASEAVRIDRRLLKTRDAITTLEAAKEKLISLGAGDSSSLHSIAVEAKNIMRGVYESVGVASKSPENASKIEASQ